MVEGEDGSRGVWGWGWRRRWTYPGVRKALVVAHVEVGVAVTGSGDFDGGLNGFGWSTKGNDGEAEDRGEGLE